MNVKELIERLAGHDPEWPVVVTSRSHYGWDEVETTLAFLAEKEGDGEIAVVALSALTGDSDDS